MLLLHNRIQHSSWGPTDGLVPLVGSEPTGRPEAELWLGTHHSAPSMVVDDAEGRTLAEVIAADPIRWLGPELAATGLTTLPFLLKVLAIGSPLSLQAHPSAEQAEAGFTREGSAGIPVDAPHRIYRDPNPKPEVLVALNETWALCGFREAAEAAERAEALGIGALEPFVDTLASGGPAALSDALAWLLHLTGATRDEVATGLADAVSGVDPCDLADPLAWVRRLTHEHPGDPTAAAPLLMPVLRLAPGEAVHLPAGNLHAYLQGAGIEVMAASDNVLRGGLTPKHVDVNELLRVLPFVQGVQAPKTRRNAAPGVSTFDAGDRAFALAMVDPAERGLEISPAGPSLLLATGGPVEVAGRHGRSTLAGGAGGFVGPGEGPITVSGRGKLWWATTGDALPA
ncbi:mannose-6-phosphate isomerase, class I [soil metagenome]